MGSLPRSLPESFICKKCGAAAIFLMQMNRDFRILVAKVSYFFFLYVALLMHQKFTYPDDNTGFSFLKLFLNLWGVEPSLFNSSKNLKDLTYSCFFCKSNVIVVGGRPTPP